MVNYSDEDLDAVVRTMLGEAAGEGADGLASVAQVLVNRLERGGYGKSLYDVAHAPKQFSAWNSKGQSGNNLVRVAKSDPRYAEAKKIAESVLAGEYAVPEPALTAVNYFAPAGMTGKNGTVKGAPSWAKNMTFTGEVGGHHFYSDGGSGSGGGGLEILRNGSKGDGVYGLQTLLDEAGFSPGTIDGDFGPKTERALRAYQEANGLTVDGVAGGQTFNSLGQGLGREFDPLPAPKPLVPTSPAPTLSHDSNPLMPETAVASYVDTGRGPVKLASGKMIAPGVYPASDGHQVRISDDGNGQARIERVRGPGAIPGVMDPMREMGLDTVAGGFIRRVAPAVIGEKVAEAAPEVANALVGGVQNSATKAIDTVAPAVGGLVEGAKNGLGSLWDNVTKFAEPQAPATVSSPETRLLSLVSSPRLGNDVGAGPNYTGLKTQQMLEKPTFNAPGRGPDWATLQTVKDVMLYPKGNEIMPRQRPIAQAPQQRVAAAPAPVRSNFAPSGRTRASVGETAESVWREASGG